MNEIKMRCLSRRTVFGNTNIHKVLQRCEADGGGRDRVAGDVCGVEWQNGGMVGWWNGGMVEWWDGGMVGWWNGGMVGWWNGGMVGWQNGGMVGWWDGGMEE